MKKRLTVLSLAVFMILLSTACGSKKEVPDLSGTWKSKANNGSYQEAILAGNTIEINWVSDGGKSKSI